MRGFSLLGAVIAIGIAGALGLAVPVLVAANTSLRTTQIQSSQAYYSARGALEFAQRQIRVESNPATLPTRNFKGFAWTFTRANNTVQVATSSGSANKTFSMTDPVPAGSQAACLVVNVSGATLDDGNNDQLQGVTLGRTAACNTSNTVVTIVSMTVSWTADTNRRLKQIRINGSNYYDSASGLTTGSLFTFSSDFVISDSSTYSLDNLTWSSITSASQVTMVFNMSDGTSKTAVAN